MDVLLQVHRFYADVGSAERSPQQCPKVLDPVCVNMVAHIFNCVIDKLMRQLCAVVSAPLIRDQGCVCIDVPGNQRVKDGLRALYDHFGANAATAFNLPTTMALPFAPRGHFPAERTANARNPSRQGKRLPGGSLFS
jgi:hypothetical protein